MKKPKKAEKQEKMKEKSVSFLIEVHFLIAAPNGHPSKYWPG